MRSGTSRIWRLRRTCRDDGYSSAIAGAIVNQAVAAGWENGRMRVFISSLNRGFEAFRDAAASGVETLGHQPIRAETFGAAPGSPQQACLAGVREADVLLLLLGAQYGHPQASGLSATHDEYREARDTKPVIVLIQQDVEPEASQAKFIEEVQGWEHGHFSAGFHDADDLQGRVIRALHDYVLANETGPSDESELTDRATALIPGTRSGGSTDLVVAIAGAPLRAVLRPAELESEELRRFLLAEALTGPDAVLTPALGTDVSIRGAAIHLSQSQGSGFVALDEVGGLLVVQPAVDHNRGHSGITSIIEEVITERIAHAIRFCARILDHVDPAERVSHVVPVGALRAAGHLPWRTRAEYERNPNTATMGFASAERVVVTLSPAMRRRAALVHDTQRLAEDLAVRLRREVKG